MPLSKLEAQVVIHKPLAEVLDFVDDNHNDPLWQTSVLESIKVTDGEPRVGTIYHVKEKFLGRVIEQDWRVTARSSDGREWAAETTTGPFPMQTTMRFEEVEGGTRIIRTLSIDVGRFFSIASPVVAHIAKRELEMDFANLKELLEAS